MALITADKIVETSSTVGAGSYTLLGAVNGNYRPASAVCANGSTFYYHSEGVAGDGTPDGSGFEIGLATWQTGNILARTSIHASSNSGAPVSWATGTRRITLSLTARAWADMNTGMFASGTWGISITGNAATATSLSGGSITTGTNTQSVGGGGPTNTQFMGNASYAAAVSFHRPGAYAINLGLDADNVFRLGGWSDGTNVYRWTADTAGNFIARGNVTAYSDERLKANWRELPDDFVSRLSLVKTGIYDRLDNGSQQVGVSAQSLQALMPDAVLTPADNAGYLSVAYGNAALAACVMLARDLQRVNVELAALRSRFQDTEKIQQGT